MDVAGPSQAPAIILLHGIAATRAQWAPQVRALADAGYRVVAPDLPGHGDRRGEPFRFDDAIEDLHRTIDAFAGGRALVVGLSLGGYLAIEAAAASPGRFAGVALTGCSANPHGLFTAVPTCMALLSRVTGGPTLGCITPSCARARGVGDVPPGLETSTFAARHALLQLSGRNILRALSRYPGPVALINGERDTLFRLGELSFLASAQDGALQIIRGAGHAASVDAPEAYTRAIRRFARSIGWS